MPEPPEEERGVMRFVRPFFEESTLWPVLAAGVGIVVSFVAGMLLMALRTHSFFAMAALAILLVMSVDATQHEWRSHGGPGLIGRCLLGLWVGVGLAAWGAVALGLF